MKTTRHLLTHFCLVILAITSLTTNAFAEDVQVSTEKSLTREATEGTILVASGTYASGYVILGGLAAAPAVAATVAVGGAGAAGYGVGKIIRGIDNKTGKHLYNGFTFLFETTDKVIKKAASSVGLNQDTNGNQTVIVVEASDASN
jgi:hypothetical protein